MTWQLGVRWEYLTACLKLTIKYDVTKTFWMSSWLACCSTANIWAWKLRLIDDIRAFEIEIWKEMNLISYAFVDRSLVNVSQYIMYLVTASTDCSLFFLFFFFFLQVIKYISTRTDYRWTNSDIYHEIFNSHVMQSASSITTQYSTASEC